MGLKSSSRVRIPPSPPPHKGPVRDLLLLWGGGEGGSDEDRDTGFDKMAGLPFCTLSRSDGARSVSEGRAPGMARVDPSLSRRCSTRWLRECVLRLQNTLPSNGPITHQSTAALTIASTTTTNAHTPSNR